MTRVAAPARRLGHGARTARFLMFAAVSALSGCNGAPSRNILGSYFPSWMICALIGLAVAGIARAIFKSTGFMQELPAPFVVLLAIGCTASLAVWLLWLA
ncbi:MAG TPA: YtcA family lipoprotein [Steroidobacteraceae bacterium]|nr:YtcA family lipoprotein [Steroidobacteraceae bacterium]